jgi:hypothetical protein
MLSLFAFFGGLAQSQISANTVNTALQVGQGLSSDGDTPPLAYLQTGAEWLVKVRPVDYNASRTDQVGWTYARWYVYGEGTSIKLQMETGTGSQDRIWVEEYHDGSKYTYTKQNTTHLIAEMTASAINDNIPCPNATQLQAANLSVVTCDAYHRALLASQVAAIDLNKRTKTECKVEDFDIDHDKANKNKEEATVVRHLSDGNVLWRVGGFHVETAKEGEPVSIWNDEMDASTAMEIISITPITASKRGRLFQGCDVFREEIRLPSKRQRMLSHQRIHDEVMSDEDHAAHEIMDHLFESQRAPPAITRSSDRHLSAWTDFQAMASGTQWCGAGTDLANTACPVTSSDGADEACHRFDHCTKANGIIGGYAVRLACDCDRGLADRTSHWAVQAIFGSWGLAQTWGCYDQGTYSCWNWKSKWWGGYWRYGGYCNGEHVHYGPWRYSSYSHSYGWKSQSRCATTLPWCTGCI